MTKFFLVFFEPKGTFDLIERLVVANDEAQATEFVSREGKIKCVREISILEQQRLFFP